MSQPTPFVKRRNCPLFPNEEKKEIAEEAKKSGGAKYGFKKGLSVKQKKKQEEKQEERGILQVGSHHFKECPVAYQKTDMGLVHLIDLINWSEEMKTPLFEGGLERYTAWFFCIRNIVLNEQRLIEWEEHEKSRQKASKDGKKSKASKPKVGGRPKHGKR